MLPLLHAKGTPSLVEARPPLVVLPQVRRLDMAPYSTRIAAGGGAGEQHRQLVFGQEGSLVLLHLKACRPQCSTKVLTETLSPHASDHRGELSRSLSHRSTAVPPLVSSALVVQATIAPASTRAGASLHLAAALAIASARSSSKLLK